MTMNMPEVLELPDPLLYCDLIIHWDDCKRVVPGLTEGLLHLLVPPCQNALCCWPTVACCFRPTTSTLHSSRISHWKIFILWHNRSRPQCNIAKNYNEILSQIKRMMLTVARVLVSALHCCQLNSSSLNVVGPAKGQQASITAARARTDVDMCAQRACFYAILYCSCVTDWESGTTPGGSFSLILSTMPTN